MMSALAIVEHLDVLKDRGSSFISVVETTVMHELIFSELKKTSGLIVSSFPADSCSAPSVLFQYLDTSGAGSTVVLESVMMR